MPRKSAKPIGALWRHESEKVGQYLTGILDLGGLGEVPIAVFKNDRKKDGSKQPDYRIVLSGPPSSGKAGAKSGESGDGDGMPF